MVYLLGLASVIALLGWTRLMLIILGVYKNPVLKSLRKYGDHEDIYRPLPELLFWLGLLVIFADFWLRRVGQFPISFLPIGGLFWVGAYLSLRWIQEHQPPPNVLLASPRWLCELADYTTRLERRRVAYMWLRLHWRTQLDYNSNDRAFLHWADMIVLATLA